MCRRKACVLDPRRHLQRGAVCLLPSPRPPEQKTTCQMKMGLSLAPSVHFSKFNLP